MVTGTVLIPRNTFCLTHQNRAKKIQLRWNRWSFHERVNFTTTAGQSTLSTIRSMKMPGLLYNTYQLLQEDQKVKKCEATKKRLPNLLLSRVELPAVLSFIKRDFTFPRPCYRNSVFLLIAGNFSTAKNPMNVLQQIFKLRSRLDVFTELLGLKGISGHSEGVFY